MAAAPPDVWISYRTNPVISHWDSAHVGAALARFPFIVGFACFRLDRAAPAPPPAEEIWDRTCRAPFEPGPAESTTSTHRPRGLGSRRQTLYLERPAKIAQSLFQLTYAR